MAELHVKRHLDADDVREVEHLIDRVYQADGHRPIDEHRWVDAAHGGRSEFAGLVLRQDGHDHLVAYSQVTKGDQSWAIDLVIDPHHRYDALIIAPRLLGAAVDLIADEGGGHVHWWVYEPTEAHTRIADLVGLAPGRDLYQMRVPIPLQETTDLVTRPFVPGQDEERWLEVNNAAFHWHPEQGGWTLDDVTHREQEPWFDPEGFLLHEVDGRLAGFCWTKVHQEPHEGEIYVIAVHPDFAGRGLGRALTIAGLAHLSEQTSTGMLYVDAGNEGAVRLYEDLGFRVTSTNRAFVGDVARR
ncbi:MAG TPA: mycothiol synthase [Acidimicrobiales bacterium]|nr:mycothiol synthase [Acidimicrobiales bacterium]